MINGIPSELWLVVVVLLNLGWLTVAIYSAVRYFRRDRERRGDGDGHQDPGRHDGDEDR